ncbi:glycosyltransferase family 2 protein [Nocardioides hwasunensis]|uniref:glycosyltransferase family 2 protein n=1 Tax=Nocardioides hwasunensis TaxID=397258 RepID=UPI0031CEF5B3
MADAMDLPDIPARRRITGSVWAVAMVKNEVDMIEQTIDHLRHQGVDGVLVADNGSTDGTRELLRDRAGDGLLHVGDDNEPAYFQAPKMRYLAAWAGRAGADWVVPFDADEWWYGAHESLAETLRASSTPIASAVIHNAFPAPDEAGAHTSGWQVDRASARLEKVAYRSHRFAALHHGNHGVSRPGRVEQSLRILHFPWRSEAQFLSKVATGAAALRLTGPRVAGEGGDHWRDLDDAADELGDIWRRMLLGEGHPKLEWSPSGELVPIAIDGWARQWDPAGVLAP